MTVVDSSAIVAVILAEPGALDFSRALENLEPLSMSAGTLLEIGTVLLHRKGRSLIGDLDRLLALARIEVVPVSEQMAREAIEAYGRFGKCTQHPAQLNFGDCFSYALAKSLDRPLLFKCDDFSHTDIVSAL